jgi:starch synthase (maltosyl-transferring)
VPVREGSEEYLDSEKYEAKERALDGPLLPLVRKLNEARRGHPALRWLPLAWLETESDDLIAYAKKHGDDVVVTVVNLNPFEEREGVAIVPAWLGLPPTAHLRDLLLDETFTWHIGRNYVRLGPGQAHVLAAERA